MHEVIHEHFMHFDECLFAHEKFIIHEPCMVSIQEYIMHFKNVVISMNNAFDIYEHFMNISRNCFILETCMKQTI